jgi:hypothetical protein
MVVLEQLEAVLTAARSELRAAVGCVVEYRRPFRQGRVDGAGVPEIAAAIDGRVDDALRRSDAGCVHVVAHSLGGVATRYWHDALGGRNRVAAIVTLGSPLAGTPWARFGVTAGLRELAPGSRLLNGLAGRDGDYRHWTTVGAAMDALVPRTRAHLRSSRHVDIRALGHLGLLTSGVAGGWVCAALLEAEDRRHTP